MFTRYKEIKKSAQLMIYTRELKQIIIESAKDGKNAPVSVRIQRTLIAAELIGRINKLLPDGMEHLKLNASEILQAQKSNRA